MNEEVTIRELFQRMLQSFEALENPEDLPIPSTDQEFDPAHPYTLLVMMKWYHNPEDISQFLMDHYTSSVDDQEKMKVAKAMRFWQLRFSEDFQFNSKVKQKMLQLQELMKQNGDTTFQDFMELDFVPEDHWGRSSSPNTTEHMIYKPRLNFDALAASDLAEILTSIDYKLFQQVPLREICVYAKVARLSKETPHLEEYIHQFNGVANWVVCNILREYIIIKRADIIEKFIDTTRCLFEIHSFNSMLAVVGGLHHFAIQRLKKTWGRVQAKKREELKKFTEFFSIEFNYGQYRQKMNQLEVGEFQLPVLGIVLKDLVAIDSQMKDFIDKAKGYLNLIKYQRLLNQLGIIKQDQVSPPDFHPDYYQMTVIRAAVSQSLSDDEVLEDLSKTREPPMDGNEGSPTRDVSSLLKFADWADRDIEQLGPEMAKKHIAKMVDSLFHVYDSDQSGYISIDEFLTISSNFPFIESFSVLDRDKDGVISRDEMMDYFLSANTSLRKSFKHKFVEHTFIGTAYCEHCRGVLKGIVRQGVRCKDCGISCHKHCKDDVVVHCDKTRKKYNSKRSRRAYSANTTGSDVYYDEVLFLKEQLHKAEFGRDNSDLWKGILSDVIREMTAMTGDPELTALRAEIISILSITSATESSVPTAKFDDIAIQELKERISQLKMCVQRTRSEEHHKIASHDQVMERLEMEVKMSRAKSSEISKLTADLESVNQKKEVVTKLLSEILCDIIREMAPATGDPELTALQEGIVSILSSTPFEFHDRGIQQLREKMCLFKACVQRKKVDQPRLEMEVEMSHAKNSQISKLKADLERANQENEMKKKNLEDMERLFLAKKEKMSILETDLQLKVVENSKLCSSLQVRDQRIATLEPRLRAKEEQLIAALNADKKQCSDAAVQANYLAVTECGLKGVEVSGEKIFEVTANSSEKYKWDSHGFQLTVPNGALPPGVTATVAVRSIVAGPFKLPQDSELIGAIYWISSTHIFKKKVTVHLQHCAIISTEAECSHFKIIIGKCSQDPPYTFAVKDGVFTPHSQSASMSVTQFSIFGMVYSWLGIAPQPVQRLYIALIFHKQMAYAVWQIVLVVVQDVRPFEEFVQEKFREFVHFHKFSVQFEEESESISVEMSPREKELWRISPFMDSTDTVISKRAVDNYQDGQLTIPRCDFLAEWISPTDAVKNLMGEVKLTQKDHSPKTCILFVNISPQPTQGFATPAPNVLGVAIASSILVKEQLFEVESALPDFTEWKKLGANLGLSPGKLEVIKVNHRSEGVDECLEQVLLQWLKRNHDEANYGPPTWNSLAKAVQPINNALAIKIQEKHC